MVSRILPFQAVTFQPRLLAFGWRRVAWSHLCPPRLLAPVSADWCPPGLGTRPVPRRRSLPSHSGHQSEHPPWDRWPDATALSSRPPGSRDWTAAGPISLAHAYGFWVCSPRLRSPSQDGGRSSGSPMVQLLAYRPPGGAPDRRDPAPARSHACPPSRRRGHTEGGPAGRYRSPSAAGRRVRSSTPLFSTYRVWPPGRSLFDVLLTARLVAIRV